MVYPRQRKSETVYYARFRDNSGKWIDELAGTDKRKAESLESKRKREVAAGTYGGRRISQEATLETVIRAWLATRTNKTKYHDEQRLTKYVLPALGSRRMSELEPIDCINFVRSLVVAETNPKTVSNIWGALCTCLRDANLAGTWPYMVKLPKGVIPKRQSGIRDVYPEADIRKLTENELWCDMQLFGQIAFYTGMREGEICGLRWSDWQRECPVDSLSALVVRRQYDGVGPNSETKTANARIVPVHPLLEDILGLWYENAVTDAAPIVEHRLGKPHSKSTCYKAWVEYCKLIGVTCLGIHRSRHTAITAMRRGGALPSDVERITHNSSGSIVDRYTHEWSVLCNAVRGIAYQGRVVTRVAGQKTPARLVEARGIEPGTTNGHRLPVADLSGQSTKLLPAKPPEIAPLDAGRDARREYLHTAVACWHCGDVLIRDKWDVPRCERCPAPLDCDDEDCEHCAGSHEDKAYEALEAFQSHPRRPYLYKTPAGDVWSWARAS